MLQWTENTHMVRMNWTQQKAHSSLHTRKNKRGGDACFLLFFFFVNRFQKINVPVGAGVQALASAMPEYFPATQDTQDPSDR